MPYVPQQRLQTIRGTARTLASWPGSEDGRFPVAISLESGTVYWDAPVPVDGSVEVLGNIWLNNIDAPANFPRTHGIVRRVRMEWQEHELSATGRRMSAHLGAQPHYEDVEVSYLPAWDSGPEGTLADAEGARALRWTGCLIDLEIVDSTEK